ncbi:DUF7507 domain-containing protein [Phaeacidiphilus oryzae]|uniref:DUF7507 domain-containing protein n=1 Tax=Phaeacidiphilus oryzae TaxID=348818 RepID=UPI000AB6D4FE|nr:DUF11 domain-containing protein [Phaeacidiphilus oryzae]
MHQGTRAFGSGSQQRAGGRLLWGSLTVLVALLAAVLLPSMAAPGAAAAPAPRAEPPWSCQQASLLFRSDGTNTAVEHLDKATGQTWAAGPAAGSLDGLGYNTQDDYVYGWSRTTSALVRLNGDLSLNHISRPPGMPNDNYRVGDFDQSGHLWQMSTEGRWIELAFSGGSAPTATLLRTGQVSPALGTSVYPGDWSYLSQPGVGTGMFGVAPLSNGTGQTLVRFDFGATTVLSNMGTVSGLPVGTYGASWSDASGFLFVADSATGRVYRIDPQTMRADLLSTTSTAAYTDGARCYDDRTVTLRVVKQLTGERLQPDDQFTVGLNHADGTPITSATTTGSETTASTQRWPVTPGGSYGITDNLAAGSPSAAGAYPTSLSCTGGVTVHRVGARGQVWTVSIPPDAGEDLVCTVTNTGTPVPDLTLVKTASEPDGQHAGATVDYTFVVTNTGNVPLTDVTVQDLAFSGTGTPPAVDCPVTASLAPGEQMLCRATYTLTQADVDAGGVTNTATASGTAPSRGPVTAVDSTSTDVTPDPALRLDKSPDPDAVERHGDTVEYTYRVTNTGNVTVTGVAVAETAFTGSGTAPVVHCPETTLAPGQAVDCTASYTVTQADIDSGAVHNTAEATGDFDSGPVASAPDSAVVEAMRTPELTATKIVAPTMYSAVGGLLRYTFHVVNTGNTTVHGVRISDDTTASGGAPAVHCVGDTSALAPGAEITCTGTYRVQQGDLDRRTIHDTITAEGTDPQGAPVPSASAEALAGSEPATLELAKSASPTRLTAAGEQVEYTFRVTNTGAVPLDSVAVRETAFSGGPPPTVDCPHRTLDPGESLTCTARYTATQADVDRGAVDNTAEAVGTAPDGTGTASGPSSAQVVIPQLWRLALDKTVEPSTVSAAGQRVVYHFTITNTGNVTVTDVRPEELHFGGTGTLSGISCPAGAERLAPGEAVSCTAVYTVTAEDIRSGGFENIATATGTVPPGARPGTAARSTAEVAVPGAAARPHTGALAATGSGAGAWVVLAAEAGAVLAAAGVVSATAARRRRT